MLIPKEEVIRAVGLDKMGLSWLAVWLMRIFKIKQVNDLYHKIHHFEQDEFINQLLKELNVDIVLTEGWQENIPLTGPFILISNHPHGALDGIMLFKAIRKTRPDFIFMGNFLLSRIKQMSGMVAAVNPLEKHKNAYNSLSGLRTSLQHLKEGGALGIFPAACISSFSLSKMRVEDPDWNISATKFIRKANCQVVPVYIHGHNSWRFQLASLISRDLKLAQQVPETFRKAGTQIKISVGEPFNLDGLFSEQSPEELRTTLKHAVYKIGR